MILLEYHNRIVEEALRSQVAKVASGQKADTIDITCVTFRLAAGGSSGGRAGGGARARSTLGGATRFFVFFLFFASARPECVLCTARACVRPPRLTLLP